MTHHIAVIIEAKKALAEAQEKAHSAINRGDAFAIRSAVNRVKLKKELLDMLTEGHYRALEAQKEAQKEPSLARRAQIFFEASRKGVAQ